MFVVIYKNLTSIINYNDKSIKQHNQIVYKTEAQNKISEIIKERTDSLVQKIGSQHTLLNDFNSDMESQTARVSEMSEKMEKISGSSEQIANESVAQVDGNVKIESIIEEFKSIRLETNQNLEDTYNDIQAVSNQSATANEHLMDVEKTVYEIKEQSSKIGNTVELIVDIADKINLLSLNASIEAARAGESGRGFAVVADEIGKLAFQTQESIKEINNVISSSSKSTVEGASVIQKTAVMMREMISRMGQGASKVQVLQETVLIEDRFTQILIDQMNSNIEQAKKISSATNEQKIAVETSFKALEELLSTLDGMVEDAHNMAKISDEIHNDATRIIAETKYVPGEAEGEYEDYEEYEEEYEEETSLQ
jgi:methyl-accepting chemotaxis protein